MNVNRFIGYALVPFDYIEELKEIVKERKEPLWLAAGAFAYGLACYHYGVMAGKRAERARRKGKAAIGAPTPTAANDTTRGSECVKCEYNTTARNMEGAAE